LPLLNCQLIIQSGEKSSRQAVLGTGRSALFAHETEQHRAALLLALTCVGLAHRTHEVLMTEADSSTCWGSRSRTPRALILTHQSASLGPIEAPQVVDTDALNRECPKTRCTLLSMCPPRPRTSDVYGGSALCRQSGQILTVRLCRR